MFELLKANVTLEILKLRGREKVWSETAVRHLETVLGRHNYTVHRAVMLLQWSTPDHLQRVCALLKRNIRVRAAVEQLAKLLRASDTGNRVQLRRSVLPTVLERIGPFPTLVYRFVRWGNVHVTPTMDNVR
jgi:hypothetical protein